MANGRQGFGGSGDELYMVAPLHDLVEVLDPFWEAYARQREAGEDPRLAVRNAVTQVVAPEKTAEVLAMLSGHIDRKLSVIKPFDGRELCEGLIAQGEKTWQGYREIPGWIDSDAPDSNGERTAPGWWQGDGGEWHAPSQGPRPIPTLGDSAPPTEVRTNGEGGEGVRDDVGVTYFRINSLLGAHEVTWQTVASRLEDLVPLTDGNHVLSDVFDAEMARLDDVAGSDSRSVQWFQDHTNRFRTYAGLHQGYGVGRLALGTVANPPTPTGSVEEGQVEMLAAEASGLVQTLSYRTLIKQSANPSALGAAIDGVSAEQAGQRLRDPVERLGIKASRRGFLIAVAEEIVMRGSDSTEYSLSEAASATQRADELVDRLIDEHGLTFDDAEAWVELGIATFEEIVGWTKLTNYPGDAAASTSSGYSSTDVSPWIESGLAYDADDAVSWLESGFSVEEASAWCEVSNLSKPNEVEAALNDWSTHGFDRNDARQWAVGGLEPDKSAQWRQAGFSMDDAKTFEGGYMEIEDAAEWREAGFTATTAAQLRADYVSVSDAVAARERGLSISATLRRERSGDLDFDADDRLEESFGSALTGESSPEDVLASWMSEMVEPYRRARANNRPLDSLFAAITEAVPEQDVSDARAFALGELDDQYGIGSGYRTTAGLLVYLAVMSETSETVEMRLSRWQTMNVVDVAEEIATDPFLVDLFLWALHNHMDEDAANMASQMVVVLMNNASTARTKTGQEIKVDQALKVLNLLAKKANQSGTEHQEMWCRAISGTLSKHR
jgi:hypothetical protein